MKIRNGNINGRRKQLFFCEIDTIPIPAKKVKLNDEIMDGSLEIGDNFYTVFTNTTNSNSFPEKLASNDETIDEPLVISTIPMEEHLVEWRRVQKLNKILKKCLKII